jgi:tRNA (uracil-5-)-methyltransferase
LLYQVAVDKVREVSSSNDCDPKQTLLFDVCCGTGTIGLTCLSQGVVGRVVGVDISIPAIKDAQVNATFTT